MKNRKRYCELHNYKLIVANDHLDKSRPPAWSKILAVLQYLPDFDYLFYLDMDIVIMNLNRPLEAYIHASQVLSANRSKDLILTSDWNGLNTGAFLIRNTVWAESFFKNAWNKGRNFVLPKIPANFDMSKDVRALNRSHAYLNYVSLPFEYEQRVFHYLFDTKIWRSRKGLPRVSRAESEANTEHLFVFPQCAFNSYMIHPFALNRNRYYSQYVNGDFLVHFAGKKGIKKVVLLDHFLSLADTQQHQLATATDV